jgi:hypothetical protein
MNDIHISTTACLAGIRGTWCVALAVISLYGCALDTMTTEALALDSRIISFRISRGHSKNREFRSPNVLTWQTRLLQIGIQPHHTRWRSTAVS